MKKITKLYSTIAILLLNSLLLLFLLNLGLWFLFQLIDANRNQALGAAQYDDARLSIAYPDWDTEARTQLLKETWSRPFVCLPFTHIRERTFSGKYIHVDKGWFRWNAEAPVWPPDKNAFNIFVFGGSTTFGYGVPDNQTIPSDMQDLLAKQFPERKIQVYNFGQGTYFSAQELRLFENLLLDGHIPDMAIFIDGINETTTQPYGWYEIDCARQENLNNALQAPFELPMMRAARAISRRFEVPAADSVNDSVQATETEDSGQVYLNRWLRNREMIRGIAANFGIKVLFVWQPHPGFHYDTTNHIFWEAPFPDSSVYPAMAAIKNEWQNWDDFLYLADMQIGREALLYVDKVHYNAAFNAEIAGRIVDAIGDTLK